MKSTLLVLSSFLLLAFVITKPSLAAHEPVLDLDGEELRASTKYEILSIFWGAGGGDIAASNKTCPLDVIKGGTLIKDSLPVTFTAANSDEDVIRVSTSLNIKFSIKKACEHSPVWKIQKSSNPEVQWFVTTGGVEGNPGCDTLTNWFRIGKNGGPLGDYRPVFCPSDICPCGVLCRNIGINVGNILSLSDKLSPFRVLFRKVSSLSSSF